MSSSVINKSLRSDANWFVPVAAYPDISDLLVKAEEIQELKGFFQRQPGYQESVCSLSQALAYLLSGKNEFVWALRSLSDVEKLLRKRQISDYTSYVKPQNMTEYAYDALYRRFPFDASMQIDVLVLQGEAFWYDPRSGPGPGAGSIASEVPHLVKQRDWWRTATLGFTDGLHLVAVGEKSERARFSEQKILSFCRDERQSKKGF